MLKLIGKSPAELQECVDTVMQIAQPHLLPEELPEVDREEHIARMAMLSLGLHPRFDLMCLNGVILQDHKAVVDGVKQAVASLSSPTDLQPDRLRTFASITR